jgi:hypothetical protein
MTGSAKSAANDTGGGLDWESQKKRLMAQLAEFDDEDEEENQERLTIDGAIRITDQVVAEKEQEIAELKAQLATAADRRPGRPVPDDLLDNDAIIQAEREKLKKLQEDWTSKLRKAEIEISVERAKLGRERAKMQEQLDAYEARLAESARQDPSAESADTAKKGGKRNWLSRLGLADND